MKKRIKHTGKITALFLAGLMTFSSLELNAFAADSGELKQTETLVTAGTGVSENEELLSGYLEQIFYGNNNVSLFAVGENAAGAKLSGDEKLAYDALVPFIKQIAAGERSSAVIFLGQEVDYNGQVYDIDQTVTFTDTSENFDSETVINALLADYPYEMYWYDKTSGMGTSFLSSATILHATFTFAVAGDYQDGDNTTVNATYASAATTSVANAAEIITKYEDSSDYEKLIAYRDEIMELVSYDTNAAENNTYSIDIDPWQLINVFDGDTETNVVCEGYAKAFQYLCDNSTFNGAVSCYSVTGDMVCDGEGGGHMWNIVTIEENNFLVDVTNSEVDSVGEDGTLFLAGTSGSISDGYAFTNTGEQTVLFTYDAAMISLWGEEDDSILKLAEENYSEETTQLNRPTNGTLFVEGYVVDTSQDDSGDNWYYDYETNTLTVTGNLTGGLGSDSDYIVVKEAAICLGSNELDIIFENNATLKSDAYAINAEDGSSINITVKEDIILRIESVDTSIKVSENILITGGGTIDAVVTAEEHYCIATWGDSIVINDINILTEGVTDVVKGYQYFCSTTIEDAIIVKNSQTAIIYGDATLNSDMEVKSVTFQSGATLQGNDVLLSASSVLGHSHTSFGEPDYLFKDDLYHNTEKKCLECPLNVIVFSSEHVNSSGDNRPSDCGEGYCILCESTYYGEVHNNVSYTASGLEIHGICNNCQVEDVLSLMIPVPSRIYDPNGNVLGDAYISFTSSAGIFSTVTNADIVYKLGDTVIDSLPIEIGTYEVSITVDNATAVDYFTISPLEMSMLYVSSLSAESTVYNGTEQIPNLMVEKIEDSADNLYPFYSTDDIPLTYDVKYFRNEEETTDLTNAGEITVQVTGTGYFTGTTELIYTIEKIVPQADDFLFVAPENLFYDANAKFVTLTANLSENKTGMGVVSLEYYLDGVKVEEPVNVGNYTVKIDVAEGTNYLSASDTWSFEIAPKEVTAPTFEGINAYYLHTGETIEPAFTLKDGDNIIPADEYTYSYSNNTDLGTATITVTDKTGGNYTVSGNKTFEIVTHTHVWTYVADEDNNTITATCSGEIGTCPVANRTVVITLDAPNGELEYDGAMKPVSIIQEPGNVFDDLDFSDVTFTNDCTSAGIHSVILTYGGKSVSTTFTIKQATSEYVVPTGLSAIYGDTLADVSLPDNFSWQNTLTTKVGNAGVNTFKVTYTPDDAVNYTTVKDIDVTITVQAMDITITVEVAEGEYIYSGTEIKPAVTVKNGTENIPETEYTVNYSNNINAGTATITVTDKDGGNYSFATVSKDFTIEKAENAPGMPAATMSTSYTNEKIGDIVLEEGWEWLASNKEIALEVGVAQTAIANYGGADKDNYANISVTVEVTRSACTHSGGTATCTQKATCTVCGEQYGSLGGHGVTEVRGMVAATCSANGYTGDTHCKTCGAKTASGYATAKLTHTYVSVITKEPTCESTGIKTYTCSKCNEVLTETLLQTGHDYESEITVKPTTEREGVKTYTCKNCGNLYTKSIDKLTPEPEKTEPFIKGNDGKEGWEDIEKELSKAKEDDIYIIDMNGSSVVPGEIFSAIKGKDVIVVFDMGEDITWRVNGKTISSDNVSDIDFALEVGTAGKPLNYIPVDVVNNLTGERTSMDIHLAYEGKFGFKTVLSVNVGSENAGLYANLFYYNSNTKSLEFVCADDVAKDGTTTLTFEHASDYVIVLDAASMYNTVSKDEPVLDDKTGNENGNPEESTEMTGSFDPETQTGDKNVSSDSVNKGAKDNWTIIWLLIGGGVLLIVVLVVVLLIKRKNDLDF